MSDTDIGMGDSVVLKREYHYLEQYGERGKVRTVINIISHSENSSGSLKLVVDGLLLDGIDWCYVIPHACEKLPGELKRHKASARCFVGDKVVPARRGDIDKLFYSKISIETNVIAGVTLVDGKPYLTLDGKPGVLFDAINFDVVK